MQFTTITLTTLLAAATTTTLAAPTLTTATATGTTIPTTTTIPIAAPEKPLSLTQKLFLAETAVDRFALLPNDADFVFKFGDPKKRTNSTNGDIVAANRKTFPALVSTGAGMAVGFLNGCAFNTPHVHPRSVELQIVTSGRLTVEMVPENGVLATTTPSSTGGTSKPTTRRVITNTLGINDMTPFYLGAVHTQFNPDCAPATFVAAFNNEDFGTGQVADEVAALSDGVVAAVFGNTVEGKDLAKFRAAISPNVAKGVEACLAKCNIKMR